MVKNSTNRCSEKSLGTYENFGIDISGVETQEDSINLLLERFNEKIGSHKIRSYRINERYETHGRKTWSWVLRRY